MLAASAGDRPANLHEQLAIMLSLNGRCRWAYPQWPLGASDRQDYLDFYFRALDAQRRAWQATGQPLPLTWPNPGTLP